MGDGLWCFVVVGCVGGESERGMTYIFFGFENVLIFTFFRFRGYGTK